MFTGTEYDPQVRRRAVFFFHPTQILWFMSSFRLTNRARLDSGGPPQLLQQYLDGQVTDGRLAGTSAGYQLPG